MAVIRRYRTVLIGGFAAALVAIGWAAVAAGPTESAVWLDAPLDGATVPASAEVQVLGHVTASEAIAGVRLDVDGADAGRVVIDARPGELTTVQFSWLPTSSGPHTLTLWASNVGGEWAGPAIVSVDVTGDIPTTTTSAPPATTPPTTAACEFEPPGNLEPPDGHVTPFLFATLSWDYAGCRPVLEFEVEVSTSLAFFELVATSRAEESTWTTPNLACGTYWWRVRAATFDDLGPWSNPISFTVRNRSCP